MSKEIKVIKQTVSVLNKQDLFILYEKLCKEAEIDEYHYTNFIKLLEFSKLESKNAVLLIKSISKYIIPIISDGKNFSFPIQFGSEMLCSLNDKLINLPNNEMFNISGVIINFLQKDNLSKDKIILGYYNNFINYLHSYYEQMEASYLFNNVLTLMKIDCEIMFEESTLLQTAILLNKLCLFYEFIHKISTNLMYSYILFKNPIKIINQVNEKHKFKKPKLYDEMCRLLKTELCIDYSVFINDIDKYEYLLLYIKLLNGESKIDFTIKKIYTNTIGIEDNKKNLLKYLKFKLFKNKKEDLTLDEKNILKLNYEKDVQYLNFISKNKCEHIPILRQMKNNYTKLLPFVELSKEQMMNCNKCNIPILCPHTVDLIDNIKTLKKKEILLKYVSKTEDQYQAYCKICGEKILSIDSDLKQMFIDGKLIKSTYENETLGPIVWKTVNIILKKYFDIKYPDIQESLLYGLKDSILPFIRDEETKIVDNKSIPEYKSKLIYVITDIYTFCFMIGIMLKNRDTISLKKFKHGGDTTEYKLSLEYYKIFPKYNNEKIIKLILKHKNSVKKPLITFDDIEERLKYSSHLNMTNSIHIGQRKLFISEVQFLTKCYMEDKDCKFVILVGSAPGHKTHFLSTMFPSFKFILVDPQTFDLKLENNISHRDYKHKDIIHLYYNAPTNSHTYKDNKPLDKYNEKDIKELIQFLNKSKHSVFIIEDFMSDGLSEIFSRLDKCFFNSDIRSAVSGVGDFDILWNTAMNFVWISILKPVLSSIKYRLPFKEKNDTSISKFYNKYKSTFEVSKKYGIDFIKDYKEKNGMVMSIGTIYLQAWPKIHSTETRLLIKKENIHNFKFYDFTEYEEKLFYYNNIDRNFICHENDNSDKKINFCKCNDCSIENNVLVEYNTYVSNKYNVLYYIKKLDTITERPLKFKHKNNIFEILTDEDIITRLGRFKKEKDINFGEMIGNKGIKGGSEDIYSENKLLLNFINIVKKDRSDIIEEIPTLEDLIKHIFIKAYKSIRGNTHAIHQTKQLEINFLLDDAIYKYLYYIHNSYIGSVKFINSEKIIGLPIDSVEFILSKYKIINKEKLTNKYEIYKYNSYKCFIDILNDKKCNNKELIIYDNINKTVIKNLYRLIPVIFTYNKQDQKIKSYYGDIFCKTGEKHSFKHFLMNDGKEDYEITENNVWISNIEKNKKLTNSVLKDSICTKCKILKKSINDTDDKSILQIITEKENIESFYKSFNYKCPVSNFHKFVENKCSKCNLTKDMILKKDKEYYKQWYNINIQNEIKDVKIYKYNIIDYKLPSENYIKMFSNILNKNYNMIKNIGLYEQQLLIDVEKDNIKNTERYYNRHVIINGYLTKILSKYVLLNSTENLKPLSEIILYDNVSISHYFEIYENMIMNSEESDKISLFVLNVLSLFFITVWKYVSESKFSKEEQTKFKKILDEYVNNILESEKRKCNHGTLKIKYNQEEEQEETFDDETVEQLESIEDPFSLNDIDIDKKDLQDRNTD